MADEFQVPKVLSNELLARIAGVTNKRARILLDHIVKHGSVTTEELEQYGHPPRAARDVRELGFHLKTIRTKHSNGRSIAAYVLRDGEVEVHKAGRRALPKKKRNALIAAAGAKCNLCGAIANLQIDHRIPYEVAGESQQDDAEPFQVLDGVCNRKKSWECEHCENWLHLKNFDTCRTCYWAGTKAYTHVAMREERRIELVWTGSETASFDQIKSAAELERKPLPEQMKVLLENAIQQMR